MMIDLLHLLLVVAADALLTAHFDGGNFTFYSVPTKITTKPTLRHLAGFWDIESGDYKELDPIYHSIDESENSSIEWATFNRTSGLPRRGIVLSPIWTIRSARSYWLQLEGKIDAKGPALIGTALWDNLTISLYQQECTSPQWRSVPISTYPVHDSQEYVQVKFLVKSSSQIVCQRFVALAGEKRLYTPQSDQEVVGKIYVTFGVLFFIMMLISILITMLFWSRERHKSPESQHHHHQQNDDQRGDEELEHRPFHTLETIPE